MFFFFSNRLGCLGSLLVSAVLTIVLILGLLYITDHYAGQAQEILDHLGAELPEVIDWSGTVGVGIASSNVAPISPSPLHDSATNWSRTGRSPATTSRCSPRSRNCSPTPRSLEALARRMTVVS